MHEADRLGVNVSVRPEELISNDATQLEVAQHIAKRYKGYDYYIVLFVLTPFRTTLDINIGLEITEKERPDLLFSVTKQNLKSLPLEVSEDNILDLPMPILDMDQWLNSLGMNFYFSGIFCSISREMLETPIEEWNSKPQKKLVYEVNRLRAIEIDYEEDYRDAVRLSAIFG